MESCQLTFYMTSYDLTRHCKHKHTVTWNFILKENVQVNTITRIDADFMVYHDLITVTQHCMSAMHLRSLEVLIDFELKKMYKLVNPSKA